MRIDFTSAQQGRDFTSTQQERQTLPPPKRQTLPPPNQAVEEEIKSRVEGDEEMVEMGHAQPGRRDDVPTLLVTEQEDPARHVLVDQPQLDGLQSAKEVSENVDRSIV